MNREGGYGYILDMSDPVIWWHEARRCGLAAAVLPVTIAATIVALAVFLRGGDAAAVGAGLIRLGAFVFPLGCGLAAAAALGRERLLEWQLGVWMPYWCTVLRRLVIITALSSIGGAAMVVGLHLTGLWNHPADGLLGLLVFIGPSVFFIGVAALSGTVFRFNAGACAAVVVGAWIFEVFVWGNVIGVWQINTGVLLAAGALATVAGLRLLSNSERLIVGGLA